jgi:threonylcarbamoyladenosine tRNA methylthiotransferase MtaB
MNLQELSQLIQSLPSKKFIAINFGCRVNAAEINQLSQTIINLGGVPTSDNSSPDIILINTCAITKKGDYESLAKIRRLHAQYPQAAIIATGCASLDQIPQTDHIHIFSNRNKEDLTQPLQSFYTPQIADKFTHSHKFVLKVQSGCTQFCSYCIVPHRRPYIWSLPIAQAVNTVNQAIDQDYQQLIITGVNLNQYLPGFSNLLKDLLVQTNIPQISFGSIPVNCIDDLFLDLITHHSSRITNFLHIPIQSGSDRILKLMRRPYNRQKIIEVFERLSRIKIRNDKNSGRLNFGTDIIVGYPTETEADFNQTLDLCQSIGFTKIHTFRFSPRPGTTAHELFLQSPKITKSELQNRSRSIRSLTQNS